MDVRREQDSDIERGKGQTMTLSDYKEAQVQFRELVPGALDEHTRAELIRAYRYASRKVGMIERRMGIGRLSQGESDAILEGVFGNDKPKAGREETKMSDERAEMHCKIIGILLFVISMILLGMIAAGCQTLGGMCRDIESAARYGHQHIVCEE